MLEEDPREAFVYPEAGWVLPEDQKKDQQSLTLLVAPDGPSPN